MEADMEKLLQLIRSTAAETARSDDEDFMVQDYAGGNIDDAYEMGVDDGGIQFARTLLSMLGSENKG